MVNFIYDPALSGSSLHNDPANDATFYFISGLVSCVALASMELTGPNCARNYTLLLSRQVSKRSINSTLTSSATDQIVYVN